MTSIRRATRADALDVARVHVLGWQQGYRGLLPQRVLDALDPEQRRPRWTATIEASAWPARGVLLAEDDAARLLGFASVAAARDTDAGGRTGEICSFYVRPAAWSRGIGGRLMVAALDTLRAAGFVDATLWVLSTNTRAIGCYEHLGWAADCASKPDEVGGVPITDLRYRIDLPS